MQALLIIGIVLCSLSLIMKATVALAVDEARGFCLIDSVVTIFCIVVMALALR